MTCQFKQLTRLGAVAFCALLLTSTLSWAQGQGRVRKIVVFQEWLVNEAAQEVLVEKTGGAVVKPLRPLVNGMAVLIPLPAVEALARKAEVLRVEEDFIVHATGKPAGKPDKGKGGKQPPPQPEQTTEWGVDRIDADCAWPQGFTGTGIKVAVLDTGIDYTHPDLAANCKGGYNAINPRKDYKDDNGHGTHVAGIIAAEDENAEGSKIGVVGVAPQTSLYAVKVLGRRGSGLVSDIVAGLGWCLQNGMDIVNMSLGTDSYSETLREACDNAAAGMILVAAAGNDGDDDFNHEVDYPAAYASVIAVAATDSSDTPAEWSSYGPGFEVDIAAPGVAIRSTWKDGWYKTLSGTSMASPHVAGTLALVLQAGVAKANAADVIYSTADYLGSEIRTGAGLVDAEEAATGLLDCNNDCLLCP